MVGCPRPFVSSGLCKLNEPLIAPSLQGGGWADELYFGDLIFPQAMDTSALPDPYSLILAISGNNIGLEHVSSSWTDPFTLFCGWYKEYYEGPNGQVNYTPGTVKLKTATGQEYEAFSIDAYVPS